MKSRQSAGKDARHTRSTNLGTRGRSGGLAGGAGYDYQDLYVAWQLARLLMVERDAPVEVMWEKRALDRGGSKAERVYVDDVVLRFEKERVTFVQLKESAPRGGWSVHNFAAKDILQAFHRQWDGTDEHRRCTTELLFITAGEARRLMNVVDAARRSRTPLEMSSGEADNSTLRSFNEVADHLSLPAADSGLLDFLRAMRIEECCSAERMWVQLLRSLDKLGEGATITASVLVRLVARSKHLGHTARSSYTRRVLQSELEELGAPIDGATRRNKRAELKTYPRLYVEGMALSADSEHTLAIEGVRQHPEYWPLFLRTKGSLEDGLGREAEMLIRDQAALPDTGLIVVEGDPGSGKSFLFNHLSKVAALDRSRIPVLCQLNTVEGSIHASLRRNIAAVLRMRPNGRGPDSVLQVALSPKGILLLDGWDEVDPPRKKRFGREIVRFARRARVIITTRRYQDLQSLGVDSSTPYFEINDLADESIHSALNSEIQTCALSNTRRQRLERLARGWQQGSLIIRRLSRNPQILRFLMEFYASQPSVGSVLSEAELIREAVNYCRRERPPRRIRPARQRTAVLDVIGEWCWSILSEPGFGHGHREFTIQNCRAFWLKRKLSAVAVGQWLDYFAESTIWLGRLQSVSALKQARVYQIRHPLFMSWFAAQWLAKKATNPRDEPHRVLDEIARFATNVTRSGVDRSAAAQVLRLFGAVLPQPETLRMEEVLCRLLTLPAPEARELAFHLVSGAGSVISDDPPVGSHYAANRRRSTADLIALQIRGSPVHERVSLLRTWTERARHFRARRDEEESIELLSVLRGLVLTPSGDGRWGQSASAPLSCWAERSSEVVVRAYLLTELLVQRVFGTETRAPDDLVALLDGRLALLRPAPGGGSAPDDHDWIPIQPGIYAYGDLTRARDGRALAPSRHQITGHGMLKVARYPVTVFEYLKFDPSSSADAIFDEPARPKVHLSWFDAYYYSRWRAGVEGCPGIDLPTEQEWESVASILPGAERVFPYPWSFGKFVSLKPREWQQRIQNRLRSIRPGAWKQLGVGRPWEYGPWPLPLDRDGLPIDLDLCNECRVSPIGLWDVDGVAQWTRSVADSKLETVNPVSAAQSRVVRGSGWGPGREQLYRCAYRRAFTPDFSSFLTGCRLVWRRDPIGGPFEPSNSDIQSD